MTLSHAGTPPVIPLTTQCEVSARHELARIGQELGAVHADVSAQLDSGARPSDDPKVIPDVRTLSQAFIKALEERATREAQAGQVSKDTQRLIDSLKALATFESWISQRAVSHDTSPQLFLAALTTISELLCESRQVLKAAYSEYGFSPRKSQIVEQQPLAELRSPPVEMHAGGRVERIQQYRTTESSPRWVFFKPSEWLHSLAELRPSMSDVIRIGCHLTVVAAIKWWLPETNLFFLLTAVAVGELIGRAINRLQSARGVAWVGGLEKTRDRIEFGSGKSKEGRGVGLICGAKQANLEKSLFVTDGRVLAKDGQLVLLESILQEQIKNADSPEARERAQRVYDLWYPASIIKADPSAERAPCSITLPVKDGIMVSLPVPRGWHVKSVFFSGNFVDTSVRHGVLGGARIQIPKGVRTITYRIEELESPTVITQEMKAALADVLPEFGATSRNQHVSRILDAHGLAEHDRAHAHLAIMTLLRFYYLDDAFVGRVARRAKQDSLQVLEAMRCGVCDGLAALLVRWQREDSLVAVVSTGLVMDGESHFAGDAGHSVSTTISDTQGLLDLDPANALNDIGSSPFSVPLGTGIPFAQRARIYLAAVNTDNPQSEVDLQSVRAWHRAILHPWQRGSQFPRGWNLVGDARWLMTTIAMDADRTQSWQAGAQTVFETYLIAEQDRYLSVVRSGDFLSTVPYLADIDYVKGVLPDENMQRALWEIQHRIVAEFLHVGQHAAPTYQREAFITWVVSSFSAFAHNQHPSVAPDFEMVSPTFIKSIIHSEFSEYLTSDHLIRLATSTLHCLDQGFAFRDVQDLMLRILHLHKQSGKALKGISAMASLVEAHYSALLIFTAKEGVSDDDKEQVRTWCREWIALVESPHEVVIHGALHGVSPVDHDIFTDVLRCFDAITFQVDESGNRTLSQEISKMVGSLPSDIFVRPIHGRTITFLRYLRENIADPTEIDRGVSAAMLKALRYMQRKSPKLVIPELSFGSSRYDPVSDLCFELLSTRRPRAGTLADIRSNFTRLMKEGLVRPEQYQKEIIKCVPCKPEEAMQELFTFSHGSQGPGLYFRDGGELLSGGVNIVDLPSAFLEMLEQKSRLRYLWSALTHLNAEQKDVDRAFSEIARGISGLTPSLIPDETARAVASAVHRGLESRLLSEGAEHRELYLSTLALRISEHRITMTSLKPSDMISKTATDIYPEIFSHGSPVGGARMATMFLHLTYPRSRTSPHEFDSAGAITGGTVHRELQVLGHESRKRSSCRTFNASVARTPFDILVADEPPTFKREGDMWRAIIDRIPVPSDWNESFVQEVIDTFSLIEQRTKIDVLRRPAYYGGARRGIDLQLSLTSRSGDLHGLRPYNLGEDLRKVNQRASARRESPVVMERYEEERSQVALVVDMHALYGDDGHYYDILLEHLALACMRRSPLHITFIGRGVLAQHTARFDVIRTGSGFRRELERVLRDVARSVYQYEELLLHEMALCGGVLDYSRCLTLGELPELPGQSRVVLIMSDEARRDNWELMEFLRKRGHRCMHYC